MRINILHMGFFYSGGGERVALMQARLLRERGHKVKVFSSVVRWDKCYPDLLAEIAPERIVPRFPFYFPCRDASAMLASSLIPFRLRDIADCDVLVCQSQPSMWLGYRSNVLFGTPYVGYLHQLTTFIHKRPSYRGSWSTVADFRLLEALLGVFGKKLARQLDRLCHIRASRLLFNSLWTKKLFEREYRVTGEVCYPGIDIEKIPSEPKRERMVVTASRHVPWKRIDLAFQVLKRLQEPLPTLVVTGKETEHTPFLKQLASNLGLSKHVHFSGHLTDNELHRTFSKSKAYVQTSIYEPFGLGPVEAQSFGTPAVVWGDAGTKETVLDGETGFQAEPYSVEDFSSKLSLLLSDDTMWEAMSRNAQIWATSFDWESHIDLLEDTLDEAKR